MVLFFMMTVIRTLAVDVVFSWLHGLGGGVAFCFRH